MEQLTLQPYDFERSMSGEFNGTQQKFSEIVGWIVLYIPCQVHRLNTFVQHSCNTSNIVTDVFSVLEDYYAFFTASTKRNKQLVDKLNEIENAL